MTIVNGQVANANDVLAAIANAVPSGIGGILGTTATPGVGTPLTVGANLTISGGALNASSGPSAAAGATNSVQINGGGPLSGIGPLANGQLLIGSTGLTPVAAALTAGANVTITNAAGSITIAASASAAAVTGPGSAVSGNIATFNGTTGKIIQDGGAAIAALLPGVATISALRAATTTTLAQPQVYVRGYTGPADGGEGVFVYVVTDSSSADNGGTIIVDASSRRWYRDTGEQPLSLVWFGAKPATGDNSTAVAAWLAVGGALSVPPGIFAFATGQTLLPGTVISGPGTLRGTTASMTMLAYAAGSLTQVNIGIDGVTFDGGAAGVTAFSATLAQNVRVENCNFTGIAYPVVFSGCFNSWIDGLLITSNAAHAAGQVNVQSNGGTAYSYGVMVSRVTHDISTNFGVGGTQVTPLILVLDTENTNVVDCYGVNLAALTANTIQHIGILGICQGVIVSRCQSVGASVGIGLGVSGGMSPGYIQLIDNDIDSFGTAGIQIVGTSGAQINIVSIDGGSITAPEGSAVPCVDLHYCGIGSNVADVVMYQWQGYPTISGVGVQLTNCADVNITTCSFGQLTTAVNFVGSGNSQNTVALCSLSTGTNAVQGTLSNGNRILDNNWGSAAISYTAPTAPASGTPYVNDTGWPLQICVSGTVTVIGLNNGGTGLTSGAFTLPPGGVNSISIAYTGTLGWNVSRLI